MSTAGFDVRDEIRVNVDGLTLWLHFWRGNTADTLGIVDTLGIYASPENRKKLIVALGEAKTLLESREPQLNLDPEVAAKNGLAIGAGELRAQAE